jgi:hypothetical protein
VASRHIQSGWTVPRGDRTNPSAFETTFLSRRSAAYLETIIAVLLPYFSAAAADIHEARSEIIDTLASSVG